MEPKKSLGQHWLRHKASLDAVVDAAEVGPNDVVLEIGPGLGTLTKVLAARAKKVIALELDENLMAELEKKAWPNVEVVQGDILKFDLTQLPLGYKVVANIPYYLTSNLLRVLSESANPPAAMSLLVQKEVAQRIAAGPGEYSLLGISVQLYYQPKLHKVVPAKLFIPPPKIDSQIVSLVLHPKPLFDNLDTKVFFQIVKAGFAGRRKKLRGSLAAGLRVEKSQADELLKRAGVNGDLRAQELSLEDWHKIYTAFEVNAE